MGKHEHLEICNHNIQYCSKCDTCYCDICGTEWTRFNSGNGWLQPLNYSVIYKDGQYTLTQSTTKCGHREET